MQNEKEIQQYLSVNVNPLISQMLVDIIKEKPKNVLQYCKLWCEKKIQFRKTMTHIESDEDEDQIISQVILKGKKQGKRYQERRAAVCGQIYGNQQKNIEFQPNIIKKKNFTKNRILFRLKSAFIFNDLDENDISLLINAMDEVQVQKGKEIIREGDVGKQVYILDSGELQCFKIDEETGKQNHLKSIREGQIVGELSLLYNMPRSASIRAKRRSILFKLDRKTFYVVFHNKNTKKRQMYNKIISKVDFFQQLEAEERDKLSDIIKQLKVHPNQYIIRQGRVGNKFYMIEKGQLVALKKTQNGNQNVVFQYNPGDYFGQLSLINNKARAASVVSITNSKLLYIQRQAFERIIGPMESILQRSPNIYRKYISPRSDYD